MENLKLETEDTTVPKTDAACGPGCDCAKPAGKSRIKIAVTIIVLLAVAGIVGYKLLGSKQTVAKPASETFAAASGGVPAAADTGLPVKPTPVAPAAKPTAVKKQDIITPPVAKTVKMGETLDSFAALNKLAMDKGAVFIVIPTKGNDRVPRAIADAISASQKAIESKGTKIGVYTLSSGSPEYTNIASQVTLPGLLVMSKGKGAAGVQGEITEDKILQAFVASSRAGGCGPSSSGCGPATPGCN